MITANPCDLFRTDSFFSDCFFAMTRCCTSEPGFTFATFSFSLAHNMSSAIKTQIRSC
eukprot:COSAG04_NODE_2377_length_4238_cov_4.969105_4_plen_58_part_00